MQATYNYDQQHDVLYVGIGNRVNSYGDDETPGVILLRDFLSGEITGITIFNFLKRYRAKSLPTLPEKFGISYDELASYV